MFLKDYFLTYLCYAAIPSHATHAVHTLHALHWIGEDVLCGVQIAEFGKDVFCRIKIVENVLVVELRQLNKCTILQSARPPCSQASLFLAGDSRLIFIIVLVGLRYLDLESG